MILYKLVDENYQTHSPDKTREITWNIGETYRARDLEPYEARRICSDTVLHAFVHPIVAIVMWHHWGWEKSEYKRMLRVEGNVVVSVGVSQVGCDSIKVIEELTDYYPWKPSLSRLDYESIAEIVSAIEETRSDPRHEQIWEKFVENPGYFWSSLIWSPPFSNDKPLCFYAPSWGAIRDSLRFAPGFDSGKERFEKEVGIYTRVFDAFFPLNSEDFAS